MSVYAVVKRYPNNKKGFVCWTYKPNNHRDIYNKLMEITENDHEISDSASSWCELASVGEVYEFREGEIEILEIN